MGICERCRETFFPDGTGRPPAFCAECEEGILAEAARYDSTRMRCPVCYTRIVLSRRDAVSCGARCRMLLYRMRHRRQRDGAVQELN